MVDVGMVVGPVVPVLVGMAVIVGVDTEVGPVVVLGVTSESAVAPGLGVAGGFPVPLPELLGTPGAAVEPLTVGSVAAAEALESLSELVQPVAATTASPGMSTQH